MLFLALLFLDGDRIDARETCRAGGLLRPAEGFQHSLGREIAEAVGLDVPRISSTEWLEAMSSRRVGVSMP